jgi:hypothetical protein
MLCDSFVCFGWHNSDSRSSLFGSRGQPERVQWLAQFRRIYMICALCRMGIETIFMPYHTWWDILGRLLSLMEITLHVVRDLVPFAFVKPKILKFRLLVSASSRLCDFTCCGWEPLTRTSVMVSNSLTVLLCRRWRSRSSMCLGHRSSWDTQ